VHLDALAVLPIVIEPALGAGPSVDNGLAVDDTGGLAADAVAVEHAAEELGEDNQVGSEGVAAKAAVVAAERTAAAAAAAEVASAADIREAEDAVVHHAALVDTVVRAVVDIVVDSSSLEACSPLVEPDAELPLVASDAVAAVAVGNADATGVEADDGLGVVDIAVAVGAGHAQREAERMDFQAAALMA